jgi:hypothetical protein
LRAASLSGVDAAIAIVEIQWHKFGMLKPNLIAILALTTFSFTSLLLGTQTFAAESSSSTAAQPGGESITDSEAARSSILDNVHFGLFSTFHGPVTTNLGSPRASDANGNPSKRSYLNFDSEATGSYMINDTVGLGVVVPFIYSPAVGQDIALGDVGIRTFDRKFISSGNFTVYANFIVQASTSTYSQAAFRQQAFALKTTPNFRYVFHDSRFTVGAWTEAKAYMGAISDKLFKLYGAPYVNYTLTPKFSLNLEFEYEADHMAKTTPLDFKTYQTDLCPGFVYMVLPTVMVNPYFQIFTTDKIAMDHTALGANISASL